MDRPHVTSHKSYMYYFIISIGVVPQIKFALGVGLSKPSMEGAFKYRIFFLENGELKKKAQWAEGKRGQKC